MKTPVFITIEYRGYFILTASDREAVQIAAEGYGIIAAARSVRGAKCKISRMIARGSK
jgi:hypothetical protein